MVIKITKDHVSFGILGIKIGDEYNVIDKRELTNSYLIDIPHLKMQSRIPMNTAEERKNVHGN